MADENIPEKMYTELKRPSCPKDEDPLVMDDPGVWYCENPKCNYVEYNNITFCQSDVGCRNLVLSKDMDFYEMEEKYCQVNHPEGYTCLGFAHAEQDHFETEQQKIDEHMKHCNNLDCECRNM